MYEVKSINWSKKIGDSADTLRENLLNKANFAKSQERAFEVVSHKPISPEWKQWFTENNIRFYEG